ncbi:MAG: ABC1 kinase family protein [Egibacteraceae bacterium]
MIAQRARLVVKVLSRLVSDEATRALRSRREPGEDQEPEAQVRRARAVRQALEDLGPFYVKVGQMLSTRPDMVPEYIIPELETLHDRIAPLPFSTFEPVLSAELGPGWLRYFRDIDTELPLGAASLAQVYRVTLANGRPAVVKVQRPGIKSIVLEDMALMRRCARFFAKRAPRFNAVVDLEAMLNLIFEAMEAELDFTVEATNMKQARRMIKDFATLSVPKVEFVSPRVLAQSMAPGCSIRDANRQDFGDEERKAIGRDLIAFMYRGYFIDRMFHADPHPGNIFVHPGEKAYMIDWGMVGRMDRRMSMTVLLILVNLAQNDGFGMAKAWIEMGRATPWADISAFSSDMAALAPKVTDASLEELNFGLSLTEVLKSSTKRGIRTPPMVSLLGKSFANLDGSVRYLAPELAAADVLEDELRDIVIDLAFETLSQGQAARNALELMIGVTGAAEQLRGLVRDLSNRELTLRVNQQTEPPRDARAKARQRRLIGLGAVVLWLDLRRRTGR